MYTRADFEKDFPTEEACLHTIFTRKNYVCPCGKKKMYHIKGTKRYDCSCGRHVSPLTGTIFSRTSIPLKDWFYVIFLYSQSKNGVASAEIARHLGCTYKTALRMSKKLRQIMKQGDFKLSGTVEADEAYIGGSRSFKNRWTKKTPIIGAIERGGRVKAKVIETRGEYHILPFLEQNVAKGTRLITDDAPVYRAALNLKRDTINHSKQSYVFGDVHTNGIEGFWGQFKNSLRGTYHGVTKAYLQSYLDQFCFYHNHRDESVFHALMERI